MSFRRRDFLKGGLATLAAGPFDGLPVFAAPSGWNPGKKPNLVFGIQTDTHLMVEWNGKSLYRTMTLDYVRNAFKLFKEKKIDAFLHLGDGAHRGADREIEFHRELFEEVFGKKGGPAKLLVPGNHEWFDCNDRQKKIWPNDWQKHSLMFDFPRNWGRAWGVKFEELWHKEVNGYHFFGRDWNTDEEKFAEFVLEHAESCSLKGTKPFFILSHKRNHFKCNWMLRDFPNAVAFCGHWHSSNADWKTIYFNRFGGFLPTIQCGACRFDGGNTLNARELDNESFLKDKSVDAEQGWHSNKVPSRQAMVVNVYDKYVVFERHEVGEGGKLGPDWVLPLDWERGTGDADRGKHPFSREELVKVIGSPEFPRGAKLVVQSKMARADALEGAPLQKPSADTNAQSGKKAPSIPVVRVTIPLADGNPDSRVFAYDAVAIGDDPKKKLFKSTYFEGCNLGVGHEPNKGITLLDIPTSELPEGKVLTIAVRPLSSLGTKGKPLVVTYSTSTGSVRPKKIGA